MTRTMARVTFVAALLGSALIAGCAGDPSGGEVDVEEPMALEAQSEDGRRGNRFIAHLDGDEEVPPRETPAEGTATFRVNEEGTAISYRLTVMDIENVVAAHIHQGARGVNGPVVAFLAGPFPPGGGRRDGVLAEGEVTADDLVGPLAGRRLGDLIAEMRAGNTYVNVHTNDGKDPPDTGPGDFPGGEIRGQIERDCR